MLKTTHRFTILLGLLLTLAWLVAMPPQRVQAQEGPPPEDASANLLQPTEMPIPPFSPGTVLVGMRGDVAAAADAMTPTAAMWGGIEVLAVEPLDLRSGEVNAASGDGVEAMSGYKLTVPVGTEWEAIEALSARGDVVFAEPDWVAQIAQSGIAEAAIETPFAVADTLYQEQWYLQRIGTSRAWSLALDESGGDLATITVAVIDTGVDFSHPDLAGILTSGQNYISSFATPFDDNGHGTHISGLIAAAVNGAGMVGPGLDVQIIPLKVLNASGTGSVAPISTAIRDAADEGADIINLSLEFTSDSFTVRAAVQYAVSKGVLVIAASGNQGKSDDPVGGTKGVSYPAAYPSVLAVGATTYFDAVAYYSNQGADLDIVAPGGNSTQGILSAWTRDRGALCPLKPGPEQLSGLLEVNGGLYCVTPAGTSMATGITTGVAALIMSLRPDLTADEVQAILLDSAAPIAGSSDEVGQGRLDAAQAMRMALKPTLIYDENSATVSAVAGAAPFTVTMSLANPALAPLSIEMTQSMTTTWYALLGPRTGQTRYGEPLDVQLVFTPTAISTGTVQSSIRMTTTAEGAGTTIYSIPTRLQLFPAAVGDERLYLPTAQAWPDGYRWAQPGFTARTNYTIGSDGTILADLPFTMTVGERTYTDIRIFADGFVVASASAFPNNLPNECLDNQTWPSYSVYGWWSDLRVGGNSSLSTFQPDANRFVIEYNNFLSADSSDPDDQVSFQIVLRKNGEVELNYGRTPEHRPQSLTVGASAGDGRFYNQVTCYVQGEVRIGETPHAYQSFVFTTGDFY